MFKFILLFLIFISISLHSIAQVYLKSFTHKNCSHFYQITTSKTLFSINEEQDSIDEVSCNCVSPFYFKKEHYVAWCLINVKYPVMFYFTLKPQNFYADIDFLIFTFNTLDEFICDRIKTHELLPVRSNLSRENIYLSGETGLKADAKNNFVGEGPGEAFSNPLNVVDSCYFLLVIDDVYGNAGIINLEINPDIVFDLKSSESLSEFDFISKEKGSMIKTLNLNIYDKVKTPINAKIFINEIDKVSLIPLDSFQCISSLFYNIDTLKSYLIEVYSDGLVPHFFIINTRLIKSDIITQTIFLDSICKNAMLDDKNILFKPNSVDFVLNSNVIIDKWSQFLLKNPNIKIEIRGNVNFPIDYPYSRADRIQNIHLSKRRAIYVRNHLVKKGVAKNRMKVRAFSNKNMLFPEPETPSEKELNRRVEIKISDF